MSGLPSGRKIVCTVVALLSVIFGAIPKHKFVFVLVIPFVSVPRIHFVCPLCLDLPIQTSALFEIRHSYFHRDISKWSPYKSEHPLKGGNRLIPSGVCGATPPSERLLGNHGWTEVVFAVSGTCRYPGMVLQWMDAWPLRHVCFLLLPQWYNSNRLLQRTWIYTWQSGCWVRQYLQ